MVKKTLLSLVGFFVVLESYQLATESTSVTSVLANMAFENNLHEVAPRKFYRSSEMTVRKIENLVAKKQLRSVIDVRMDPHNLPVSYMGEETALSQIGVSYHHLPLKGSQEMTQEQLLELMKLIDEIEEPALVHCSSGTHRSGVVAAIYLMEKLGVPYEEAALQLSSRYGFISSERKLKSYFSGKPTIDNVIWRYGNAYKQDPNLTFRAWVERGMS